MLAAEIDQPVGLAERKDVPSDGEHNSHNGRKESLGRGWARSSSPTSRWAEDTLTISLRELPSAPNKPVALFVNGKLFFESRPATKPETVSTAIELPPLPTRHDSRLVEVELRLPARNLHKRLEVDVAKGSSLTLEWSSGENKDHQLRLIQHHTHEQNVQSDR